MVFFMDATPPRHRLEPQDVDTVADFLTRFTRSIGQSHMFKLTRDRSLKNVLTFTNIKNLLRSLRHSNLRTGLSYDRNILEYDLKPGSVNIVLIIGLPSQLFLVQAPEGYAIHTVAVGKKYHSLERCWIAEVKFCIAACNWPFLLFIFRHWQKYKKRKVGTTCT